MSSFWGRVRPVEGLFESEDEALMRLDRVEEKARVLELDIAFAFVRDFGLEPYRWASLDDIVGGSGSQDTTSRGDV